MRSVCRIHLTQKFNRHHKAKLRSLSRDESTVANWTNVVCHVRIIYASMDPCTRSSSVVSEYPRSSLGNCIYMRHDMDSASRPLLARYPGQLCEITEECLGGGGSLHRKGRAGWVATRNFSTVSDSGNETTSCWPVETTSCGHFFLFFQTTQHGERPCVLYRAAFQQGSSRSRLHICTLEQHASVHLLHLTHICTANTLYPLNVAL